MKYAIAQTSGKQFLLKPVKWYDVDLISNGNLGDFIYLNNGTMGPSPYPVIEAIKKGMMESDQFVNYGSVEKTLEKLSEFVVYRLLN